MDNKEHIEKMEEEKKKDSALVCNEYKKKYNECIKNHTPKINAGCLYYARMLNFFKCIIVEEE